MTAFKFRVSQRKGKKYDGRGPRSPDPRAEPREPWLSAVFADGHIVSFGGLRGDGKPYAQYKDRTSLKAYSAYDHKDKAYYKRHGPLDNEKKYTADWFSKTFLW